MSELIAKYEFEVHDVLKELSQEEKIKRLTTLYSPTEILDVLGWYDESNPDMEEFNINGEPDMRRVELYAINNGNFTEAIAMNIQLPI